MIGEMVITLGDDGTLSIDSTKMKGSASEILKELNSLSTSFGEKVTVEKHVGGIHSHETGSDHVHN